MTLTKQTIEERIRRIWVTGEHMANEDEFVDYLFTLFLDIHEELIGEENPTLPTKQSYYEDTPSEIINKLGESDGRNILIKELHAKARALRGK